MTILEQAKELLPTVIGWRRYIHKNAELSFEEYNTQSFIIETLSRYDLVCEIVGVTGVLVKMDGSNATPESPVVLRADIDALPIKESSPVDFACHSGVMHACGHDIHTASLMGALILLKQRGFEGTIWGLFQPGEELHPGGASILIKEGVFDKITPRYFVGQHCSPELEVGTIGIRGGQFMASTDEIHITVNGKGGHGAMPHNAHDVVLAASALVIAMQQVVSRNAWAMTPSVLSFGRFIAKGATNILPDKVQLEGTFRTMDEKWRAEAKKRIIEIATNTALAYGCEAIVDVKNGYPVVFNNHTLAEETSSIAKDLLGEHNVIAIDKRMTAEDFGFYAEKYPSIFYRLGTGGSSALHTSTFCPDESSLIYGMATMVAFASLDGV